MATTDYDFSQTRNEIIESAFRKIGKLAPGQALPGEQAVQGAAALNVLVKSWQSKRIFLWNLQELTPLTFAVGEYTKALDNSVLGVEKAWYRNDSDADIKIDIVSYANYEQVVSKSEPEATSPSLCAINYTHGTPTLYIWPKASESLSVYLLAVKKLQDMDNASSTPEIPQRFYQALIYGLADILADEYGVNINERQYIKNKSDEYFAQALSSDYEYEDVTMVKSSY